MNNDRWQIQIKNLNGDTSILEAIPNDEILTKYVNEAVTKLQERIALAEEMLIFGNCTTDVLERIRDYCDKLIKKRK